jgi:hypothetical protein
VLKSKGRVVLVIAGGAVLAVLMYPFVAARLDEDRRFC